MRISNDDDTTSLAVGWTHGCLRCGQRKVVTVEMLEQHIGDLEHELRAARELLAEMKAERRRAVDAAPSWAG